MTDRKLFTDATVRLEQDSVCITLARGTHGDDEVELWIPASKAVHAATALLEIYFGRVRAAKLEGKLWREWESERWREENAAVLGSTVEEGA